MAASALAEVEGQQGLRPLPVVDDGPVGGPPPDDGAAPHGESATLAALKEYQSRCSDKAAVYEAEDLVFANRDLPSTTARLAMVLGRMLEQGRLSNLEGADHKIRVSRAALARAAGCSKSSVTTHLKKLEQWGVIHCDHPTYITEEDDERLIRTDLYVRWSGNHVRYLELCARVNAPRVHGGSRQGAGRPKKAPMLMARQCPSSMEPERCIRTTRNGH